jgi:hypothetical protein
MADDCSRLWHLSDSQLLAYFNCKYPQPQPWQLVHLRSGMHSTLMKALQQQRPTPQLFLNELALKMATGKFGKTSLPLSKASTRTSKENPSQSSFLFSKFLLHKSAQEQSLPAVNLSKVEQWRTTYGPSERKLHWMTTRH